MDFLSDPGEADNAKILQYFVDSVIALTTLQ